MLPFYSESDLKSKVFSYLVKCMGYVNQIRINHWQTTVYAEHKLTDELFGSLNDLIDKLAETTMGIFSRPQITMTNNQLCDIKLCNTKNILDTLSKNTNDLMNELKDTEYEDLKNIMAEFFETINKAKYLLTLE
jgi:DNA-binding ferritin-like protein